MHRRHLPQLDGSVFVTDGCIETTLIFHQGLELPEFAAIDLLKDNAGTEQLRRYYAPYMRLAREHGVGLVLESPTWRANPDWAAKIGYSRAELDALNRKAITLMEELRDGWESEAAKSHAELDESEELDEGDPQDLGARHAALKEQLPRVNVLGGCCGTDHRHVAAICDAWIEEPAATRT